MPADPIGAPGRWRQRLVWSGLGFLAACVGFALFSLRGPEAAPDGPARAPSTPSSGAAAADLEAGAGDRPACYLGVVLASDAVDVVAEIDGRVEEIVVRAGDPVRAGQRIAALDTQDLRHELRIAQASLASVDARRGQIALEAERAEHEYQRRLALQDLVSKEAAEASKFERADAELRLEAAEAERDQVAARIAQLEASLARSELKAPFDGVVALRYLDAGSIATAGTPVVRLISSGGLLTRFAVPPEEALELAVGMPVRVEIETLRLAVDGTVGHIAPEIDSASQMVFVEARLASGVPRRVPARAMARVSILGSGPLPPSCLFE